jgi:Ser/Thr protein kinase RdoA (MazF antagonist)
MSQSRRSLREGGPAPVGLEFAAALLPWWGLPPGTGIAAAGEQGTNNRTFLVGHGQQRYVLRVSGFLSVAEVRAEHRIVRRLRQGGPPFQVPEPVAAPDGRTVIETTAGPELLIVRSLGSVLWRAARWRAGLGRFGLGRFGEVTAHVGGLEATTRWLAANGDAFLSVAAPANAGS